MEPIPNPKGVGGSIGFGGTMEEFMMQGNDQRNDVQSDIRDKNAESDGQSVAPRMKSNVPSRELSCHNTPHPRMKFNVPSRDLCCNNICSRMTLTQLPLSGLRKDRVHAKWH